MRTSLWGALGMTLLLQGFAHARPCAQVPAREGYSAAALYNQGNAFALAGKPGMAVLNYERASLLEPDDPDIAANLKHVRETAGLPRQPRAVFERAASIGSPRILAWIGLAGLIATGGSILLRKVYPRRKRYLTAAAIAGLVLMGAALCNAFALWPKLDQAVVIARTAPVRASPVPIEEPSFALPEASLVALKGVHDEFVLVETEGGRSGWVPGTSVAPIIPHQLN